MTGTDPAHNHFTHTGGHDAQSLVAAPILDLRTEVPIGAFCVAFGEQTKLADSVIERAEFAARSFAHYVTELLE